MERVEEGSAGKEERTEKLNDTLMCYHRARRHSLSHAFPTPLVLNIVTQA